MKFLIGLALILMGIFVEAKSPALDDSRDDSCDCMAYKKLEETMGSRIKDIEVGVRLIGEDGKTPKEFRFWTPYRYGSPMIKYVMRRGVVGRIEVLQPGGWQKLCVKGKSHSEHWILARATCKTLGYENGGAWVSSTDTIEKGLEESGVSKYDYDCKEDEKSIFECDREEKESECDADGPPADWATANCWFNLGFYSKDWEIISN